MFVLLGSAVHRPRESVIAAHGEVLRQHQYQPHRHWRRSQSFFPVLLVLKLCFSADLRLILVLSSRWACLRSFRSRCWKAAAAWRRAASLPGWTTLRIFAQSSTGHEQPSDCIDDQPGTWGNSNHTSHSAIIPRPDARPRNAVKICSFRCSAQRVLLCSWSCEHSISRHSSSSSKKGRGSPTWLGQPCPFGL